MQNTIEQLTQEVAEREQQLEEYCQLLRDKQVLTTAHVPVLVAKTMKTAHCTGVLNLMYTICQNHCMAG